MSSSPSTPRLRITLALLVVVLALVAVSERGWATGLAGVAMQLAALACIACAALGRVWSSVFIAGFKDESLVRTGPYSALRHPLYALSLLAALGIGLSTRSLAITVALLAALGGIHLAAAKREDAELRRRHGAAFEEYRRSVPPYWPRASTYAVPEQLAIRPRVLWKAFLDAGSLLGYFALLVLADALQLAGVTPTWLSLP
jgi:protein-S-isoprenylcysteine O-methyltransferase Ste14